MNSRSNLLRIRRGARNRFGKNDHTRPILTTCIIFMNRRGGTIVVGIKIKIPPRSDQKVCLICGKNYTPVKYQYERQKYCSKTCKEKNAWEKCKEKGIHKGGYTRHIPIVLFLNAMGIDKHEIPCGYCGTTLTPYTFIIDHKTPRSVVLDKHKIKNDISNMQLVCKSCNNLKGSTPHDIFKTRMEGSQ